MNRLAKIFLKHPIKTIRLNSNLKKIAKKNTMPFEERYKYMRDFIDLYHNAGNIVVKTYGLENIPKDMDGGLLMSNHQGKSDAMAIFKALPDFPTSFIINDERSHMYLMESICNAFGAKRINFNDLKSQLRVYNEMADEIAGGKRFIVFPEAKYTDNKNNLQEFFTPCFVPAIKSKTYVIPICLYDTYKVLTEPGSKPVYCEVHFLKPITPDEVAKLNKKELCDLVKNRIQEKLDEIKKTKGEK